MSFSEAGVLPKVWLGKPTLHPKARPVLQKIAVMCNSWGLLDLLWTTEDSFFMPATLLLKTRLVSTKIFARVLWCRCSGRFDASESLHHQQSHLHLFSARGRRVVLPKWK